MLLIGPLGTNFSEILIEIHNFHSRKCCLRNGGHLVSASMCQGESTRVLLMWLGLYMFDVIISSWFNTLRPRQNGRHFTDDTFKRIFLKENVLISIKISLNFVPKSPIDNIPALVQIMAWRRSGDKPLSEPMMVSLLTHICVTRPQWVNQSWSILVQVGTEPFPEPILTCHQW